MRISEKNLIKVTIIVVMSVLIIRNYATPLIHLIHKFSIEKEVEEDIVLEKKLLINGLTEKELNALCSAYSILFNTGSLRLTENTEKKISYINYYAFDHEDREDYLDETALVLKKYGFDSDNRLTSDWIMNNLHDAYYLSEKITLHLFHAYMRYEGLFIKNEEYKQDGLSIEEYIEYAFLYRLKGEQSIFYVDPTTEYLDGTQKIKLEASEETERLIKITNELLWDFIPREEWEVNRMSNIINRLEKHGITKENKLTSQWVIENPYEAYYIMTLNYFFWTTDEYQEVFRQQQLEKK
ncbi:hypothetical protein EDC19_1495 [Natranaerovirga hydrolytica]|uniref:Uncharacterized protein n=1 Tax=Natranaerovirga hydrolytica TaxID=680378 RepID=A0A4R1MPQ5_9FIRM|nr:hypothetical protein [Natranaerovirga hydrolytica]TCK93304.1 hypothetical protein EDC19_1495 [Natranaerovirga hydrolytica]